MIEDGSSLYGGIAILRGSELLSAPGCCCALDTIQTEWRPTFEDEPHDWTEVDVGDDADRLQVRFDGDRCGFEYRLATWNTTTAPTWDRSFRLQTESFRRRLDRMLNELTHLADDISAVLPKVVTGPSRDLVAKRMAGLL